eukprot:NODE_9353_length_372_cov_47.250774_g8450_i0.p1 GENE.NODE_9353_length_372_cov_47.250774_g8450_i0~~NODE_9353_length_372_cov_47.250774_g8450_i0.p1  ORF type:complete len:77 (-),score=3.21 NODE_9353_length_372_cov_47.250774_g8450_i0:5-235(-)
MNPLLKVLHMKGRQSSALVEERFVEEGGGRCHAVSELCLDSRLRSRFLRMISLYSFSRYSFTVYFMSSLKAPCTLR